MKKNIIHTFLDKSPFLVYLPFLFLYLLLVLKLHGDQMVGDEGRYYGFAQNLLNGFYSPPPPDINLWNGPGYPIFLMPFVALGLPLICITLCNAFFQYLSIIFLFKAILLQTGSRKIAYVFSMFWACYYIAFQELGGIITEPLTSFLTAWLIYLLSKGFKQDTEKGFNKYLFSAGLVLGYLVLTKSSSDMLY